MKGIPLVWLLLSSICFMLSALYPLLIGAGVWFFGSMFIELFDSRTKLLIQLHEASKTHK